jgi:hypothetical protein
MLRVSSLPAQLAIKESKTANTLTRNASFFVKDRTSQNNVEKVTRPCSMRSSSFMMLDAVSRKCQAAAKSMAMTRAMSSDVVPSLPVRLVSPIKETKHLSNNNAKGDQWKTRNHYAQMLITEEESGSDSESPVILQPEVKSNMFFKGMSVSKPRRAKPSSGEISITSPSAFLKLHRSPVNLAAAARLGASEKSDSEFLPSRWSSSSSMTSVRMHESISSSMEFFLDGSSGELNNSKSSLGSSRTHNSMSSFRAPKERGLTRSNSSLHLEETMLKGWK